MPRPEAVPRRAHPAAPAAAQARALAVAVPVFVAAVLAMSSGGSLAAQPFQYQWLVSDLAAADADVVELGTRRGAVVKRVKTEQMRVLYAVSRAIEEVAELEVALVVVDGAQPNAFAGRGTKGENVVGVNFAMLELLGSDVHSAAALLGHEIAHLKLSHGEDRAEKEMRSNVLGAIGGAVLGGLGVPGGNMVSNLTVAAVQSNYSRENEREADYLGAIWAVEAGFEADGAVRLHRALRRVSPDATLPFLSTHPAGPERIRTLEALAARLSGTPQR